MSANQQFKQYVEKLEIAASGKRGPLAAHSKAKLAMLHEMDRTERFKWFCANVLGEEPVRRNKRAEAAQAVAESVYDGEQDNVVDRDAAITLLETLAEQLGVTIFGGTVVEKPKASKPKAKVEKASKTSNKRRTLRQQDEPNRWRKSTLKKLGYKSRDGQTFTHKGTRWLVIDSDNEFAYTVKA